VNQPSEAQKEIDDFYANPTLEGLQRAHDPSSYYMRIGALMAFKVITKEDGRKLCAESKFGALPIPEILK